MKRKSLIAATAMLAFAGCSQPSPPPETALAPTQEAAAAAGPLLHSLLGAITLVDGDVAAAAGAPVELTLARAAEDGEQEGMDALVSVQLTAADQRSLTLTEANHAPYDLLAQAAGGPLADAIDAPRDAVVVLYRPSASSGAPLMCGPGGPQSVAMAEDGAGGLIVAGLSVAAFAAEAAIDGTEVAAPLPANAVCGRAVYRIVSAG